MSDTATTSAKQEEFIECYIGNGQTVRKPKHKGIIAYLDIKKIEKYLEENPDESVRIGCEVDESWTATSITQEEFNDMKNGYRHLLRSSCWDRFFMETKNGREDCTVEIPNDVAYELIYMEGFSRGLQKVDQWLNGLYAEGIRHMEYEMIEEMQKEMEPIIKKYKELGKMQKKFYPKCSKCGRIKQSHRKGDGCEEFIA